MNHLQTMQITFVSSDTTRAVPIRVSIVEDDALVRESLAVLIGGASGFCCVGAYASAEEALREIPHEQPEIILMDIHLPKMSGVECVRSIKELLPTVQVLMLTMYEDDQVVFDSLRAGASGYLLKRTPHAQILAAIQDLQQGGSPMTSSIARKVVQLLRVPQRETAPPQANLPRLSPRENEILTHLAKGYRYKEIAETLGINIETVRTHLRRIYEKLHVGSRTEAVVKFLQE
jgi:DNA-binding NarL/FixJ family response regulator